jgi:hypothetical protein
MKIGDVEIKKIQPGENIKCSNGCGNATAYFNATPFCAVCLVEKQQLKWNEDGQFFENNEGERVHYEVVRKVL